MNTTFENRLGGDMNFIAGKGDSTHSYFERNKTKRLSTQLTFDHQFNKESSFEVKNRQVTLTALLQAMVIHLTVHNTEHVYRSNACKQKR